MNKKNNKNNKKRKNKEDILSSKEIQHMKQDFKDMVDKMSNDEFLAFIALITFYSEDAENLFNDEIYDEGWEDEAEEFYNEGNNKITRLNLDDEEDLPF